MKITHLSAECVPFAKTGGLGDVVGALPKALQARGHDVSVFLPFHLETARWFRRKSTWPEAALAPFTVSVFGTDYTVGLLKSTLPGSDVPIYFVAQDELFHRRQIYSPNEWGQDDGLWRFSLFVRAAVQAMKALGERPQVLHSHDWHPALAPMLGAWSNWRDRFWDDVASVLTIHNVAYQGIFAPEEFNVLGLPLDVWTGGLVSQGGAVNLLKGAVIAADMITAVSPTYSWEIRSKGGGYGLDGVLAARGERVVGILNGVDQSVWNPESDALVAATYGKDDLSGKEKCREDLCRLCGFEPADHGMILGAIGRLTDQKGFDMLLEAAPELIRRGVRIAMLGSGEPALEGAMRLLEAHAPAHFRAFVGYDEGLAHKIEAGADAIVMPSRFEPCGLTQMYSLAYGTPPIVRRTGGLADSVVGFDGHNLDAATGFSFDDPSPHALAAAVLFAQRVFFHKDDWGKLVRNGMSADFSWDRSAEKYEAVYKRAREVRGLPW
ncbi:MAG TPA: glycogen synthase GlgA [Thermoanaerobaculia bacterium]|nr:glycogen synthase GlgA [Thermoanaerobaculia bacterium]